MTDLLSYECRQLFVSLRRNRVFTILLTLAFVVVILFPAANIGNIRHIVRVGQSSFYVGKSLFLLKDLQPSAAWKDYDEARRQLLEKGHIRRLGLSGNRAMNMITDYGVTEAPVQWVNEDYLQLAGLAEEQIQSWTSARNGIILTEEDVGNLFDGAGDPTGQAVMMKGEELIVSGVYRGMNPYFHSSVQADYGPIGQEWPPVSTVVMQMKPLRSFKPWYACITFIGSSTRTLSIVSDRICMRSMPSIPPPMLTTADKSIPGSCCSNWSNPWGGRYDGWWVV